MMRACWSVKAVPCGATIFCTPFVKHAIRSNWPSQMMAKPASRIARLDLSRPKKILLLVKIGVSGELTYFAVFSSPDKMRPLKPMTRPCSSQIGNISRPRKRS